MLNTVIKTALKTLLGVIIALLIAFAIASLGFPGSMASLFEKWGNYSFATGYASLNYSYTGDAEDLARCFEDGVLAKNDGDIVRFGEQLVGDEKFNEVCNKKNEQLSTVSKVKIDYKHYVYGNVASAKYRQKDPDGALNTAKAAMENETGFPSSNAVAQLALQVIERQDKDTSGKLLEYLNGIACEEEYYKAVKTQLEKVANS